MKINKINKDNIPAKAGLSSKKGEHTNRVVLAVLLANDTTHQFAHNLV